MNKTVNQNEEVIIAVGQRGSHIRNKEEFNITLPKLISKLKEGVVTFSELRKICEEDNVPRESVSSLIGTAAYYFENPKKL